MDIDAAVTFAEEYLDAEWAAVRATYAEPDDGVVAERIDAFRRFVRETPEAPFPSPIGRRPGRSAVELAARARQLDELCRRALFQVVEHRNPLWGSLFGAYTGAAKKFTAGMYGPLLYVADTGDGPRVVSEYDSGGPGPAEWVHLGGVRIDNPGPVVAVRTLAEPTWRPHREHWLALSEEAS